MSAELGALRAAARGESRSRRLLWIAVTGVLLICPAVIDSARSAGSSATVILVRHDAPPLLAPRNLDLYRRALSDPTLRAGTQHDTAPVIPRWEQITIRPGVPRGIALTARADSRTDASRIARAVARQLQLLSQRYVVVVARRQLPAVEQRLRAARGPSARQAARRGLQRLRTLIAAPQPLVLTGALSAPPAGPKSWADRLVTELPGAPLPRDPWRAALAGLVVALLLWAGALAAVPPAAARPRSAPN